MSFSSFLSSPFGPVHSGVDAAWNPLKGTEDALKAPGALMSPGGAPADTSASDTYAALTQEQWQTYLSTFVPIENQLISYATDPGQVTQAMSAAHTDVQQAQAAQAGATQRNLTGMGVTLNPAQQGAAKRETGLSAALADVQGQNMARDLTISRQQGILGNPAPTAASTAAQATALGS